ncbi:hypothetical protein FBZ86_13817 [Gluconacetobacter diazotrophicus]|nr:hypothetical protein FBZ86_13817 [Gluconacetobacter diazotrophicus]
MIAAGNNNRPESYLSRSIRALPVFKSTFISTTYSIQ